MNIAAMAPFSCSRGTQEGRGGALSSCSVLDLSKAADPGCMCYGSPPERASTAAGTHLAAQVAGGVIVLDLRQVSKRHQADDGE